MSLEENRENAAELDALLANCANEPIRTPGAIQPHGVLLALDEVSWTVQQVSINTQALLARTPESLLGQSVEAALGEEQAAIIRQVAMSHDLNEANPLPMVCNGRAVDGILHRHDGVLMLEIEDSVQMPTSRLLGLERGSAGP